MPYKDPWKRRDMQRRYQRLYYLRNRAVIRLKARERRALQRLTRK